MNHETRDDQDIRELFREARAREASAPRFERVVEPRRRAGRPRLVPAVALGGLILAMAIGTWRAVAGPPAGSEAFTITAGELRTPSDFLLDLAGPVVFRLPRMTPSQGWLQPALPEQRTSDSVDRRERS